MAKLLRIGQHIINVRHIVEASYAEGAGSGEGPEVTVWLTQTSPESPSTRTFVGPDAHALWAWFCRRSTNVIEPTEGQS
jgi:hypothetical protein